MSKKNTMADQINLKLLELLTGDEFKTFQAWFLDSEKHNSPQTKIAERTGFSISTVSKHFKKFKDLGILEENGKIKRSKNYKLKDEFLEQSKERWEREVKRKSSKISNTKATQLKSIDISVESIADDI